jgi:hypothetical protein
MFEQKKVKILLTFVWVITETTCILPAFKNYGQSQQNSTMMQY